MISRSLGRELEYIARACQESAEDIRAIESKQSVIYNLDFGLLCPVVFKHPGEGSKEFLVPPVAATRRVLSSSEDVPFQMVISGYTMMEIYDQLAHLHQRLRLARPELYTTIDKLMLREQLMTSDKLRGTLTHYTESGLDGMVRAPIEYMEQLFDSGAIRGIGDVVDASAIRRVADRAQFDRFYGEHRDARLRGERQRDVVDSEFHYKIDAVNSCLTLAMAEAGDATAYFVTQTNANLRQCIIGEVSYARLDRTPLFVMNTIELAEQGLIDGAVRYLERTARRSVDYAEELDHEQSLRDVPVDIRLDISRHFFDVSRLIGRTEPVSTVDIEQEVDGIMDALSDPGELRARVDSAVGDLADGARRLEQQASTLDLAYVNEFDFSDDPVLARIRRQLGLATRL